MFGETEVTISGLRFRPGARAQVRFSAPDRPRAEATVDAEVVDSGMLRCKTPHFEVFGAGAVDVRVSLIGEGWTVNKLHYSYFANTAARHCLAFGPGLLPEPGGAGLALPFIIQARDTLNERRTGGGDVFSVRVTASGGTVEGATAGVTDMGNGLYEAFYSVPLPGSYEVRGARPAVARSWASAQSACVRMSAPPPQPSCTQRFSCEHTLCPGCHLQMQVHVLHTELGAPEPLPVRGSPFSITANNPWVQLRAGGAVPTKRKGATLVAVGKELVRVKGRCLKPRGAASGRRA